MKHFRYSFSMYKSARYSVISCALVAILCCAGPISAQWSQKASIPSSGRDAACEFSVGSKAYFGGGYILSKAFYEYDPITDKWTQKADLPIGKVYRAFGISFSIGSKGYVAMGQSDTSNGGQPSVTNDLWQYDPTTNTWTRKADFPGAARDGAMVFVINGKAYVGAGVDANYSYLGDFYEYDPTLDKWTEKADLPSGPIGFPMAFAIDSLGYMACGGNPTELTMAYTYSPSTDTWTQISDFPGIAREAGVGFSIDSLGYVGLGESNYTKTYADFYSYDPKADKWTKVTQNFPYALGLGWPAAAVVGNTAYIGGGADQNFNYSHSWYSYVPPADVPAAVTLIAPADMSTITTPTTLLTWAGDSKSTSYHLEISMSSSFSSHVVDSVLAQGINSDLLSSLAPGVYYWRVAEISGIEVGPWSEVRSFTVAEAGVSSQASAEAPFQIQTSPNPFVESVQITVSGEARILSLRVLDPLGRTIETLYHGVIGNGAHTFQWNATGYAAGSYYLEAVSDKGTYLHRIELVK